MEAMCSICMVDTLILSIIVCIAQESCGWGSSVSIISKATILVVNRSHPLNSWCFDSITICSRVFHFNHLKLAVRGIISCLMPHASIISQPHSTHSAPQSLTHMYPSHPKFNHTPSPLTLHPIPFLTPIDLLLQHNTIHTRLQQRAHQTRLPLQQSQPIEYFRSGAIGEGGEMGGKLNIGAVNMGPVRGAEVGYRRTLFRLVRRRAYSSRTSCSRRVQDVVGAG